MSGLEVVAAVAAVISAFHGGSELLKHVRKKRSDRKTRNSARQEWEEEQLQASLVAGKQQIGQCYDRDQRELGDLVRIGDDIARERLYHITLMLQAEIINSLKKAATSEVCVLDLQYLHRASNTNRQETLTTLEELKQRIYWRRPMARHLQDLSAESRLSQFHFASSRPQAESHESNRLFPDGYASYPSHVDYRHTVQSPAEYYRPVVTRDAPSPTLPAYEPVQGADLDLRKALERLPPDHRAAAMRDIQRMVLSYHGLSVDSSVYQPQIHGYNGNYSGRREVHSTPSHHHVSEPVMADYEKEIYEQLQNLTVTPDQNTVHSARPSVFEQDMFESQKEQSEYPRPYHPTQTRAPRQTRWSESSADSSAQSNIASFDRNGSSSSQGSSNRIPCVPLQQLPTNHGRDPSVPAILDKDYSQEDEDRGDVRASSLYPDSEDEYTPPPIPPLSPSRSQANASQNDASTKPSDTIAAPTTTTTGGSLSVHRAWPGTQSTMYSVPRTQYTVEITANNAPAPSTQTHHRTPSSLSALVTAAASLNPKKLTRTASVNRSARPTTSASTSSTASIRTHSMQLSTAPTFPLPATATLHGRPNKSNDYWGFCKGAWGVQESLSKGMAVRAQPCGYYIIKHQWSCRYCTFAGPVFKAPHPNGKKGRTIDIVDPRIKTSAPGVRYRWVFLAKSHVRKKIGGPPITSSTSTMGGQATTATATAGAASSAWDVSTEDNFGCVFCCLEDRVSGVYGGVDSLMKHVLQVHAVKGVSEHVCRKSKCILGRVARSDEEFDVNIPFLGNEAADKVREMMA